MSLRQTLNDNPVLAGGVVAGLLVVALVILLSLRAAQEPDLPTGAKGMYYSEDDGKNFFVAPPGSIPGEIRGEGGNIAYLAKVIQYPGEEMQVGWLESYTPAGIAALKTFYADPANINVPPDAAGQDMHRLVKRPGAAPWARYGSDAYWQIINPPDKDGQPAAMRVP
jgi:hypothetical protein